MSETQAGHQAGVNQQEEHQTSLQHPHLPSDLVSVSEQTDSTPIVQDGLEAATTVVDSSLEDQGQEVQIDQAKHEDETQEQQHVVNQGKFCLAFPPKAEVMLDGREKRGREWLGRVVCLCPFPCL